MIKCREVFITHNSRIPLLITNTGTGTIQPRTGHEHPEGEKRYSSTLPLTSALDWGVQRHTSAALPLAKTRYSLYRRLGGAPRPDWTGVENLAPCGIRFRDRPARSELKVKII
jgi:hypothetical protein